MEAAKNSITVNIEKVIETECQHCKQQIDVSEFEPFTEIECPHCGEKMKVPGKIGNFTLLDIMGKGGMGSVYRARDEVLGRLVAIKLILPSLAQDKEFIETFKHEAQAAAKVNHPNIAQIYSFGEEDGHPYIVMELVSGRGLDTMIGEGNQLDQGMIMQIGMDIADGLREADEMGLIHGDIKPENILLDEKMNAKLIDFGIASVGGTQSADGIWGTPYYIAPEKLRREKVDARSDIYCLGATLYHALAGQPPFEGETPAEVVKARLEHEAPLLSEVRPDIDKEIERVIARMLKMERSQRYPTYTSLLGDMKKIVEVLKPQVSNMNKSKKILIKKRGGTIKVSPASSKPIITSSNSSVKSKTLRPVSTDGSGDHELTAEEKANRKKILLKILWGFLAFILMIALVAGGIFFKIKKDKEMKIKRAKYELGSALAQAKNYNSEIKQAVSDIVKLAAKTEETEKTAITIATEITGEKPGNIRQMVIPPPPVQKTPPPVAANTNATTTTSNAVPEKATADTTNAVPPKAATNAVPPVEETTPAPVIPEKNNDPSIKLTKKIFALTAKINQQGEQAEKIQKDAKSLLNEATKSHDRKAVNSILPGLENMEAQLKSIKGKINKLFKKTESPLTEMNTLLKNYKQQQEDTIKEKEQEALRKKQEAERQRKLEEHQQEVNKDLAVIGNAENEIKKAVRTQEYNDLIFSLKKKQDRMRTKEGKETLQRYLDTAIYLQDLKAFLIKQLNEHPYKWGWISSTSTEDIIKATPRRIFLRDRSVIWANVSAKQYYKITTHYITDQNKNVKLAELAKNAMGLALYLNAYGAYDRAVSFADKAINWSPKFAKEKERLLPPPQPKDNNPTDNK